MSEERRSPAYRDRRGLRHEVFVRETQTGDWQVLDACAESTYVVETLASVTDGREQAQALARDYLSTRTRDGFAGRIQSDPIPQRREADGNGHDHQRSQAHQQRAAGAALPRPVR